VRQQLELFRITNSIELLRRFEELRSHDHLDGARAVMGIVIRHQSYRKEDIQSSDATQFQQRFGPGVEPNFIPWEGSWNKGAAEVLEFLARWALLAQVNRGFVDDAFLSRVLDESKTMMLCLCRAAYLAGEHKHTRWWWNSDAHRAAALSYFPEIGGPEPYPLLK
jgi:hypothetical protein